MSNIQRQVRIAIFFVLIILPLGVIGFMVIEKFSFLDALWLTIITLTTIGYGDISASTELGRLFTMLLVLIGLGSLTFLLTSSFTLIFSPELQAIRRQRRAQKKIDALQYHYIICGMGEMVDKTIGYILQSSQIRRTRAEERIYQPIDNFLDSIFGDDADGNFVRMRGFIHRVILALIHLLRQEETLLDALVIVTQDREYAHHLRSAGLLVVRGDPTDNTVLENAGVQRARAMMVMLDSDTETLLTVPYCQQPEPPSLYHGSRP